MQTKAKTGSCHILPYPQPVAICCGAPQWNRHRGILARSPRRSRGPRSSPLVLEQPRKRSSWRNDIVVTSTQRGNAGSRYTGRERDFVRRRACCVTRRELCVQQPEASEAPNSRPSSCATPVCNDWWYPLWVNDTANKEKSAVFVT